MVREVRYKGQLINPKDIEVTWEDCFGSMHTDTIEDYASSYANYEIIMSVTQFFSRSEYRSYVGDLDTIFEKFKRDMEKHFDKHKQ